MKCCLRPHAAPVFRPLDVANFVAARQRGEKVAKRGWFVYCNGRKDLPAFDSRLEFTIRLLPYVGNDGWVENTLHGIRETLCAPEPQQPDAECEYCKYVSRAGLTE